ncbi:MAG: polysaccharide deacetylase family protein [Hyphomicrobiaceae bacterium]
MALAVVAHAAPIERQCVAPLDLVAKPGEKMPVKGEHRFDRGAAARDLAAFAPVAPGLRGAIRRVELPKGKKLIALTFDLCEQPGEIAGYDGAIFDYLRANGIKATLFTGGKWMRSHGVRFPQLMTDPLFEIANHGEAHRNLRLLSGAPLQDEISGPQRAYEAIRAETANANQCLSPSASKAPNRMTLFRFPYGACNDASLAAVNDAGLLAIQWDVSTGDPSPGTSAQQISDAMVHNARPGSIIISHANGRGFHTAAALPLAIPKLLAAGYTFVTVSELLAAGRPVIAATCYNTKPGDTDRYDHPLGLVARGPGKGKAPGAEAAGDALPWLLPWQAVTQPAAKPKSQLATKATTEKKPKKPERLP